VVQLPDSLEPCNAAASNGSHRECLAEAHGDTPVVLGRSGRLRRARRERKRRQAEAYGMVHMETGMDKFVDKFDSG
jgi:hypothetical protein